jgi:hypothetical protein
LAGVDLKGEASDGAPEASLAKHIDKFLNHSFDNGMQVLRVAF